ncbi:carbohydrate sulfotransferase 11-like isoform X1 [Branchiostoma floridae]|uniref:Carbohydrate sulfotransferase n=1 Tax=Branchiostoma floridae TaxID=7739 RepID=A0A9J7L252_BRAFL|nr:carbohydrate sulfotransferase 11-like isoform X1 [Branchiostoma floridae]
MVLYLVAVVMITAYFRPSYQRLYRDSGELPPGWERHLLESKSKSESEWETRMEKIHRDRRATLHRACQKFNLEGPPPSPRRLHKLRYNDPYRLVYCDVAKAGSTTMKKILARVDPNYDYIRENGLHDQDAFKDLSQFPAGSPALTSRLTNYTKFMIVREPLERLLSAYQDKFRYGRAVREFERNYGEHFLEVRTPNDAERWQKAARAAHSKARLNITFAEFVRGVLTGEDRYFNIHWQPQHLICHPCRIHYDYIGHLETMHDDVKYIMRKTGIIEKVAPPKQTARRAGNNLATMYAQIPLSHIRQLGRMYAFDYIAYSFHFEDTVRNIVKGWEDEMHL